MRSIRAERIGSANFGAFGSVARFPTSAPLAETTQFKYWADQAHFGVEGETEIGYCTVVRPAGGLVDWVERHERTPEVLIPIDVPVILPVMKDDRVAAFEVHPGEAAVVAQNVWHSACLPLHAAEASYFVVFRRGTPQEDVIKQSLEEPVRIEP